MDNQTERPTLPSKRCQIEGCEEISVGSKVPLCRRHRNKTYKQNYKKKKRNAEASQEENSQEIVIDDQYLLEQKYSNMLQDVLTQKQMELFESPSVVNLLKRYQNQRLITRTGQKNNECPSENIKKESERSRNGNVQQRQQSEVQQAKGSSQMENPHEMDDPPYNLSYIRDWNQNGTSSVSSNMIPSHATSSLYIGTSSSITQPKSNTPYVSASDTFGEGQGIFVVP